MKKITLYKLVNKSGITLFKGYQSIEEAKDAWSEYESDTTFEAFLDYGLIDKNKFPDDRKVVEIVSYEYLIDR